MWTLTSNSIRWVTNHEILQTKVSEERNNTRQDLANQASHWNYSNANLGTPRGTASRMLLSPASVPSDFTIKEPGQSLLLTDARPTGDVVEVLLQRLPGFLEDCVAGVRTWVHHFEPLLWFKHLLFNKVEMVCTFLFSILSKMFRKLGTF